MTALDLVHVTLISSKELKSVAVRSQKGLKQLMWSLHCGNTFRNRFSPQESRGKNQKGKKNCRKRRLHRRIAQEITTQIEHCTFCRQKKKCQAEERASDIL